MPTIKKDDQQIQALSDIEVALSVINAINSVVGGGLEDADCQITFTPAKGRPVKVPLGTMNGMGRQESTRVYGALTGTKQRLVKEINTKAQKYRIELSDDDRRSMSEQQDPDDEVATEV